MQVIVFKAVNVRRHCLRLNGYKNIGMPAIHVKS
jgi:hypothetical protein